MGKRIGLDVFLTVSLLLLMSYALFGEAAHEWLGLVFLALFVWHHAQNRYFFKNLFRGCYDAARVVRVLLMALLGVSALAVVGSGILLSRHIFSLPAHGGYEMAARLHLASAYGCFVTAGIHAGFSGAAALGTMRRKASRAWPALRLLGWALSVYGAWAFWKRDIADYLLLRAHFAFFDFADTLPVFLADYAAMFVCFACLGRGLSTALRR